MSGEGQDERPSGSPPALDRLALSTPLVRLVARLHQGKGLRELVAANRWRRKRGAK